MDEHAKWLRLEDLKATLAALGVGRFAILENTEQRNGPRITALVSR